MKYGNRILMCLILSMALRLIFYPSQAQGISHEDIFVWVANKLEIEKDYQIPKITIVPREELQRVFLKYNEKSLKRWAGVYGEERANEIMDQYLKEVVGLFNPKNSIIHVGGFLKSCKQESIVAHELAHYFQTEENGTVELQSYGAEEIRLRNEMEAGMIENEFNEKFCTQEH